MGFRTSPQMLSEKSESYAILCRWEFCQMKGARNAQHPWRLWAQEILAEQCTKVYTVSRTGIGQNGDEELKILTGHLKEGNR